jgi:hypothetical protein
VVFWKLIESAEIENAGPSTSQAQIRAGFAQDDSIVIERFWFDDSPP